MAISAISLDNLDQALPNGFSIPAVADDPEINVQLGDDDDLIHLSLIGATLGDEPAVGRLTNTEAVRLAMALLALAESNR